MENSKNIYVKLMEVRTKFHKLELKKSGHNKFANFKYFELGDFLVPATQLLQESNLCPIVTFDNELAKMTLINGDNPSEQIVFTSPMRDLTLKGANDMQSLGGVETYQTRYLYIQLLNIVESDSFDAVSGTDANKQVKNELLEKVYSIAKEKGYKKESVNKKIIEKGYSLDNFGKEAFEVIFKGFSSLPNKQC